MKQLWLLIRLFSGVITWHTRVDGTAYYAPDNDGYAVFESSDDAMKYARNGEGVFALYPVKLEERTEYFEVVKSTRALNNLEPGRMEEMK